MGKTKIEWADEVWNPITGCTPISEGCKKCYAKRMANRLRGRYGYPQDEPFKVTFHQDRINKPLSITKPKRIFVCSMGDLFHEDVRDWMLDAVFERIFHDGVFHLTFIILTKRPNRMFEYMSRDYIKPFTESFSNIWLGVTAENQKRFNERVPILLKIPTAVRFVSVEPMLSEIDIEYPEGLFPGGPQTCCSGDMCGCMGKPVDPPMSYGINWIICGAETGPGARPMNPGWARALRDQCQSARIPFFIKKMSGGTQPPNDLMIMEIP